MKRFFFALSFLVAVSCNNAGPEVQKPAPPKVGDTIRTTVEFAYRIGVGKAKLVIRDTLLEVWEPRKNDTTVSDRVRKTFYDSLYFVNLVDTVVENGQKRILDTFILAHRRNIIRDLNRPWSDTSKK